MAFPPIPRNGTVALVYPRTLAMGLFGLQFVMSDGSQWSVVNGNQATVRPADSMTPVKFTGGPAFGMIATPDNSYILTMNGSGTAYLYNSSADTYVGSRLLFTGTIQGYYGVVGAGPFGIVFPDRRADPELVSDGDRRHRRSRERRRPRRDPASRAVGTTIVNTGQRNVAAVAPLNTPPTCG